MLHLLNRHYIKSVILLRAQSLKLSLVHTNKKSMYKNTVIQQKDSVITCTVAGAMAPFTGQIRTSQEKKIPARTDRSNSTYRWQREYVEYFEKPA